MSQTDFVSMLDYLRQFGAAHTSLAAKDNNDETMAIMVVAEGERAREIEEFLDSLD